MNLFDQKLAAVADILGGDYRRSEGYRFDTGDISFHHGCALPVIAASVL